MAKKRKNIKKVKKQKTNKLKTNYDPKLKYIS